MYVDINADLCNKYDLSQYYTKSKLTKFLRINGKVRCFLLIDQIATQKKLLPLDQWNLWFLGGFRPQRVL